VNERSEIPIKMKIKTKKRTCEKEKDSFGNAEAKDKEYINSISAHKLVP